MTNVSETNGMNTVACIYYNYYKGITSYLLSEYLKTIEFNNEQREKRIRMKNRVGTVNFKELS